jgi:hypothetical protein
MNARKNEYRWLNNKLRRSTDMARQKRWEKQCDEIEELQKQGKHAQVYSMHDTTTTEKKV